MGSWGEPRMVTRSAHRRRERKAHTQVLSLGLLCLLFCACAAVQGQAQPVTTGSLALSSTFEAISYQAQFSGDPNANATARVQFKQATEASWHDAYPPLLDRRATIGGASNPYALQARGSIVGLVPSTAYQVQVTWSDTDGVSGGNPVTASVATLSYAPPTGGSSILVGTMAALTSALSSATPGQIIHLLPGTYSPFTLSRSGTPAAWIVLEGDPSGSSLITGGGSTANLSITGSYVLVQHLTLGPSDANGVVIEGGAHHVFVQEVTMQNIAAQCATNPSGHYGDAGIVVGAGAHDIFLLRNTIHSTALNAAACTLSPLYNSPGTGISWGAITTLVVEGNTVTGGFRDAISCDNSNNLTDNVDVVRNIVSGYKDDGIETKGGNVNARLWANTITADVGDTCIAGNTNTPTNLYGPLYIFRNTCRVTTSNPVGETGYKLGGVPTYLFHNALDSSPAPLRWDTYVSNTALVVLNNIAKSTGSIIDYAPATSLFDYNLSLVTSGATHVYHWNNTTDYATLADFRTGAGQEAHGLNTDPLFTDTLLHIGTTSPAVDKGVILPNFNSLDSAWPYAGAAPDIGAYEAGGGSQPRPPLDLRLVP